MIRLRRGILGTVACGLMLSWAAAGAMGQSGVDVSSGAGGIGHVVPESWGLTRLTASNQSEQTQQLLAVQSFDSEPNIQYATEVWLPPHSILEKLQVVRAPILPPDLNGVDMTTLLIDTSAAAERRLARQPVLLRVEYARSSTGMIHDGRDDGPIDAAVAARRSADLSQRLAYISQRNLPPLAEAWQGVESVVLAHNSVSFDAAQADALRQWVIAGGRLWIMLDRTSQDVAAMLLGNAWQVSVIDRVPRTELVIADGSEPHTVRRDYPLEMVRVVAPSMQVHHTVDGWPASLTMPMGRGQVLLTTLDARAWLAPPRDGQPQAAAPLRDLAERMFRASAAPRPQIAQFEDFVREQIGYEVLGRQAVVTVLGLFVVGLLVGGLALSRLNRLEHVGTTGTVLALVATVALVWLGRQQRHQVPLTLASAQVIEVAPEQDMAVIDAMLSIYSPTPERGPLRATRGGVVWPDMTGQGGRLLRMVWSDLDRWSWDGLQLPEGAVRSSHASAVMPLPAKASATLRFDERGASGRFEPGPFSDLEDAVLATPIANLALNLEADGQFSAAPQDVLPAGQFIVGVGISDLQRRRQEVYRSILGRHGYPAQATILAWTQSFDLGLELSIPAVHRDSALMAIPLTLEPTPPGQKVRVPAAFVPWQSQRGPNNIGSTTLYDRANNEWIPTAQSQTLVFRFQAPSSVLPLTLEGARLTLEIRAADRTVDILGFENDRPVTLMTLRNPRPRQTVDLPSSSALRLDRDGSLLLALHIHDAQDPVAGASSLWHMGGLSLDLEGVVGGQ